MNNENNIRPKRITLTIPAAFHEAFTREAARMGHKVASLCTWYLSLKAHEIIEEEKKKANEGR